MPSSKSDPVGRLVSFTPSWKGDSGDPAIGNGTLTGWKRLRDGYIDLHIYLKCGSTTTYGTGNWYFEIPDGYSLGIDPGASGQERFAVGLAYIFDSGTTLRSGVAVIDVDQPTRIRFMSSGTASNFFSSAAPQTWTTNDDLGATISIPI